MKETYVVFRQCLHESEMEMLQFYSNKLEEIRRVILVGVLQLLLLPSGLCYICATFAKTPIRLILYFQELVVPPSKIICESSGLQNAKNDVEVL